MPNLGVLALFARGGGGLHGDCVCVYVCMCVCVCVPVCVSSGFHMTFIFMSCAYLSPPFSCSIAHAHIFIGIHMCVFTLTRVK